MRRSACRTRSRGGPIRGARSSGRSSPGPEAADICAARPRAAVQLANAPTSRRAQNPVPASVPTSCKAASSGTCRWQPRRCRERRSPPRRLLVPCPGHRRRHFGHCCVSPWLILSYNDKLLVVNQVRGKKFPVLEAAKRSRTIRRVEPWPSARRSPHSSGEAAGGRNDLRQHLGPPTRRPTIFERAREARQDALLEGVDHRVMHVTLAANRGRVGELVGCRADGLEHLLTA